MMTGSGESGVAICSLPKRVHVEVFLGVTVNLTLTNQIGLCTFKGLRLERLLEQITHPVVLRLFADDPDNPSGHIPD